MNNGQKLQKCILENDRVRVRVTYIHLPDNLSYLLQISSGELYANLKKNTNHSLCKCVCVCLTKQLHRSKPSCDG